MKTKPNHLVVAIALMILTSSCATIFTRTKQGITFTSNPDGAIVYVDGEQKTTTPGKARVKKGRSHDILMKKKGFRDYKTILSNRKTNWVVWLNLPTLDLGWLIDASTGAAEKFTTKKIEGSMIETPKLVSSSSPIFCENTTLDLNSPEIGVKQRKGKNKSVISLDDIKINKNTLNDIMVTELNNIGYVTQTSASPITIQTKIKSIDYKLNEQKKEQYMSSCEISVEWTVKSNDVIQFTAITKGNGVWPALGNYSTELAFREAFYRFILDQRLNESSHAVLKQ